MIYDYIQRYRVSHSYMKPEPQGVSLTRQELLEEEQTRENYVVGVFHICHCIVAIRTDAIARGEFQKDTPKKVTL